MPTATFARLFCALALALSAAACGSDDSSSTGQVANSAGGGAGASGAAGSAGQGGSAAGTAGQAGAGASGASGQSGAAGAAGAAGGAGASGQAGAAGAFPCDPNAACTSCCHREGPPSTGGPGCSETACPQPECTQAAACPMLSASFQPADPAVIACVMGGLRDGTPGKYDWQGIGVPGGGEGGTIFLLPGRIAYVRSSSSFDLAGSIDQVVGPVAIKPAAYFDDCSKKTDNHDLTDCMNGAAADSCSGP